MLFDRPHDWIDIQKVLVSRGEEFEIDYVTTWLREMLGDDDSRIARLEDRRAAGPLPGEAS